MRDSNTGLDPSFAWQELFSCKMGDGHGGTLSAQVKWVGVDAIGVRLVLLSPQKRTTKVFGEGFIDL